MKSMIEAGAAGVHFEDQLASEKKCGHMGGKVLVPTSQFIRTLVAARLAADVYDVPTLLIARTDADSAKLITSDIDERDRPFITSSQRTPEGFFHLKSGVDTAIARGLAYAPYADLIWCETSTPDLEEAKHFAEAIARSSRTSSSRTTARRRSTGRRTSTTRPSPSSSASSARWATSSSSSRSPASTRSTTAMFELARNYKDRGMAAYSELQQSRVRGGSTRLHGDAPSARGRHRLLRSSGRGDLRRRASTLALEDSTEEAQF